MIEVTRDILTPEQAADYLQINRETIYRYIRSGKLLASKLGKSYRIPRRSVELLLWATRTAPDMALRHYTQAEIAGFLQDDELDGEAGVVADRFKRAIGEQEAVAGAHPGGRPPKAR
ncbi:MAG: DNA-binding protein [Dehalococcoidia bacterium]|nr:DNA-binding protein [Dehalococcoidia bacterium]